jgi:hypothetical protein
MIMWLSLIFLAMLFSSIMIPCSRRGPGAHPEFNNKIYVAHAGGYDYVKQSQLSTANNTVSTTITVTDVPNSFEVSNGNLYVICGGKPSYAPAELLELLVKINLTNNGNKFN